MKTRAEKPGLLTDQSAAGIAVNPDFRVSGLTANGIEPGPDQPRSGFGSITGAGAGGAGSSFEEVLLQAERPRRPSTRSRAEIFVNAFFIFRHPYESGVKTVAIVKYGSSISA